MIYIYLYFKQWLTFFVITTSIQSGPPSPAPLLCSCKIGRPTDDSTLPYLNVRFCKRLLHSCVCRQTISVINPSQVLVVVQCNAFAHTSVWQQARTPICLPKKVLTSHTVLEYLNGASFFSPLGFIAGAIHEYHLFSFFPPYLKIPSRTAREAGCLTSCIVRHRITASYIDSFFRLLKRNTERMPRSRRSTSYFRQHGSDTIFCWD